MQNITYLLKYPHLYQIGKAIMYQFLFSLQLSICNSKHWGRQPPFRKKQKKLKKKEGSKYVTAIYNSDEML